MTDPNHPSMYERPWAEREASVVGGVALAVLVASSLDARTGEVPSWEQAMFHAVNGLPDLLRGPMWVFQLAGLLAVPGIVAVGALIWRRWRLAAALVLLMPVKLVVEKLVVKQVVERQRPGTSICNGDTTCGNFRGVPMDGLSYVSGHAVISWGVAALLWPYLRGRWRWVPVAVAVLNSVARVYLGAHNPLDVVGGGALGALLGLVLGLIVGVPVARTRWLTGGRVTSAA